MNMAMKCNMCGEIIKSPTVTNTILMGLTTIYGSDSYRIDLCDHCKEKVVSMFDKSPELQMDLKKVLL